MIVLDPELDPDPAPHAHIGKGAAPERTSARRKLTAATRKTPLSESVPSTRSLAQFLAQAQSAVRLRGRVSVLLTTDKAIRCLNRQFRGIDKATDVLSFPTDGSIPSEEKIAGDLAISVPTARCQSTGCGHSLAVEIKVLILHGLLHLAGYDHETDSGQMGRRERRLRAQLGLPQGLIERSASSSRRVSKPLTISRKAGTGRTSPSMRQA
jgi:probable rRNA maturation factor